MINIDRTYIFNPFYALKNDVKRIVLTNAPHFKLPPGIADSGMTSFIHPAFAMVFSFFNGKDSLGDIIPKISALFDSSTSDALNFISPFFENKKNVGIEYDDDFYEFPKNILLDNTDDTYEGRNLNYEDYITDSDYDFLSPRMYKAPNSISLLVNTICATDCTYCYVDRRIQNNCKIPIERLQKLIREASSLGIVNFDIAGTEIFLYPHWKELLKELIDNNYYPYISTKVPISESKVMSLKEIGINDVQFSLDSVNENEVKAVNRTDTKDYVGKILTTLGYVEKHGLNCAINVVLTNQNSTLEGIKNLLDRLNEFTNLEVVTFNPAERATHWESSDYDGRKNSVDELVNIKNFIDGIRSIYNFRIAFSSYTVKDEYVNDFHVLKDRHENRAMCTANKQQMCILSDGKVTICEELYWHPNFIIGDVLEQSIEDVWQSETALNLDNLQQGSLSDMSNCKTCPSFNNCRILTGICWSDVVSAYGTENWDYPAPTCPYSPPLTYSMYHD